MGKVVAFHRDACGGSGCLSWDDAGSSQ